MAELFLEISKRNIFDTPDSSLIKDNGFSDSIYYTFKHLERTKKYNNAGHLL